MNQSLRRWSDSRAQITQPTRSQQSVLLINQSLRRVYPVLWIGNVLMPIRICLHFWGWSRSGSGSHVLQMLENLEKIWLLVTAVTVYIVSSFLSASQVSKFCNIFLQYCILKFSGIMYNLALHLVQMDPDWYLFDADLDRTKICQSDQIRIHSSAVSH